MFTLESHVDISKIKAGKGNPVVMNLDLNPQISFTMENSNINKDVFSALCYNLSQVGTTAAEAGQALRKIVQVFNQENQTWNFTAEALEQLADKWAEIGCTSFIIQPDEVEDIKRNAMTLLQTSRGVDLPRPETPGTTENPNQNERFDFLEQNVNNETNAFLGEASSGQLSALDSI